MTEGTSTSGATAATETAVPVAAVAAPAASAQATAPVDASVAMAAMAATTAAPAAAAAKPAAPAVGPTAAAIAAAEALAAIEAAAAKKADKADKSKDDSDESMSDAEVLPEVELASLGEGGAAAGGQAGLPCGVLPVVDAPVVEAAPPVEVPVGDAGFALSPVLLGLLGLGALGLGYLLLKGDDDDDDEEEDVNEAPVAVDETVAVNEDATATGTLDATDADDDDLTYAISGTAPTGLTLNADGSYTFDASSYDSLAAGATQVVTATYTVSDGDASDTGTITITVTGVNDLPEITSGGTATVAENAPTTTVVYDANATDVDGDTITYSLAGADAALFNINATTGEVRLNQSANFEADASYNITVVANDGHGGTDTQDVVVTVTDVAEPVPAAPVITSGATATIDENIPAGTEVYDANATDANGDTLVYTLGGADAAFFTIDAATGEVFIIASPDFETRSTYNITVTATDPGGLADTQAVAISVNNLPEGPGAPTVIQLDLIDVPPLGDNNPITPVTFNAATDNFLFYEDDDLASYTIITGFGADDTIRFEAGSVVSFGTGLDPNDLQIIVNNGGIVSEIILDDVLADNAGLIFNEATAEAAVGHDFFSYGALPPALADANFA